MKQLNNILLALLMAVFAVGATAQTNKLHIPDIEALAGKTIQIPVNLENEDEAIALQFDLMLPDGITANQNDVTLTARSVNHTVTARNMSNGRLRVMIFSADNTPIRGNSGTLVYINVSVPSELATGSEHQLGISDALLSDRDANNILNTPAEAGKIIIAPSADLTVKNITTGKTAVNPGDELTVNWVVENIGVLPTEGGWSEQIMLVAGSNTKIIATEYYNSILGVGGTVSRSVTVNLPDVLCVDGSVGVRVKVVPNSDCGEPLSAQGNNVVTNENLLNVGKRLATSIPESTAENGARTIRCLLTRSGKIDTEQVFTLAKTGDDRLVIPQTVKISKGESSAYFNITINNDNLLNESPDHTITISGGGYDDLTVPFKIIDDEKPQLELAINPSEVTEGETFTLTVSCAYASSTDATINIYNEEPKRFNHPASVVLPAGQTSVEVQVTAIDNNEVQGDITPKFVISGEGYMKAESLMILHDNDMPNIELTLTPTTVSEDAGPYAIAASVKRTTNKGTRITLKLSDDSGSSDLRYDRTIVMSPGVEEAQFTIGVVDNSIVEGDRNINFTAAVYISSCSCTAQGETGGSVSKVITVIDNDGPALKLEVPQGTWLEGSENNVVKVSHNNKTLNQVVNVTLTSDIDDILEYNHGVVIPAGQLSVDVPVKVRRNDVQGDSKTATFTVTDNNQVFSRGTSWVMISDQTLPDALITDISVGGATVYAGVACDITATIKNQGYATLPDGVKVTFFDESGKEIGSAYSQVPIAEGETGTVTLSGKPIAAKVGANPIYAEVNPARNFKELLYTNNRSSRVSIEALSPFTLSIDDLPVTMLSTETLTIKGSTNPVTQNITVEGMEIEVYVINNGYRKALSAFADEQGNFSVEFTPVEGQVGHFIVGACYPGEKVSNEMKGFDILGLRRTTQDFIKLEIAPNTPTDVEFDIVNPSNMVVTGIHADDFLLPANVEFSVEPITSIAPGQTVTVHATITGTDVSPARKWYPVQFNLVSDNGEPLPVSVYEYTRNLMPKLVGETSSINTTTYTDRSRIFPFTITNTGEGETGKISVSLPSWMKCETPLEMASLQSGESAQVVLRFEPWQNLVPNVPVTGQIGLNCERGGGLVVPYTVKPVSEETGSLRVNVCDEYTYNTVEAPYVKNARVLLRDGYSNTLISEKNTGENGFVTFDNILEGYYTVYVYADKHDSYRSNVIVSPGQTRTINATVSYQAISISWDVVETEVEDEYDIVTTVKYETNVPKPVLILSVPKKIDIDAMAPGEKEMFYATVTNKGLITGKDTRVYLPRETASWRFEWVQPVEAFDLLPQQSVRLPFYFTRLRPASNAKSNPNDPYFSPRRSSGYDDCSPKVDAECYYECHDDMLPSGVSVTIQVGVCSGGGGNGGGGGGGGGGGLGTPGGGPGGGGGSGGVVFVDVDESDDPCDDKDKCNITFGEAALSCAIGLSPVGCAYGIANMAIKYYEGGLSAISPSGLVDDVLTIAGCAAKGTVGKVIDVASCAIGLLRAARCEVHDIPNDAPHKVVLRENKGDGSLSKYEKPMEINVNAWTSLADYYAALFGSTYNLDERSWSDSWGSASIDDVARIFVAMRNLQANGQELTAEALMEYKPEVVTNEDFSRFVKRMDNSFKMERGEAYDASNVIDLEQVLDASVKMENAQKSAQEEGFSSLSELMGDVQDNIEADRKRTRGSVCASVTLQFEQKLVMTRQAFRGTLSVFNGSAVNPMRDVKLTLKVTDMMGNIATSHEFQINPETLNGFEGELSLDAGWTLDMGKTGVATILFIPTCYAAPEVPTQYNFGGTLSYIDPFTDLVVTRDLTPVTLTVSPSPVLNLTYFMQRDIYGDDALTLDVVEPMKPAEFSLLIQNTGYGDATNVRMTTQQPKIVENEKGLFVDFEILSSQLNGRETTMALGGSVITPFGTIPAGKTAYAQWWLTSTLLGHFYEYDVKATHVTSYDNPDLTLLDEVTIHELIHSVIIDDSEDVPLMGFLTNDVEDAYDYPDHIYYTDGTIKEVSRAEKAVIERIDATTLRLTVTPNFSGWNFGFVTDPTGGHQEVLSVVRDSDGKSLNVRNFWQTDRVLLDGAEPLYENRINFADEFSSLAKQTYTIIVKPRPSVFLQVDRFIAPYNGKQFPAEDDVINPQLERIEVVFNKEIMPETFTVDDVKINCQGETIDKSLYTVSNTDGHWFVNLKPALAGKEGYYVMTVQTKEITDHEGFQGETGKMCMWVYYMNEGRQITVNISDENAGTVSPETGIYPVGTEMTLKATANEGYEFQSWTSDGDIVSTDAEYKVVVGVPTEYTANFVTKMFSVTVVNDDTSGTITGSGTGNYQYGTELTLTAVPNYGYLFVAWYVDDVLVSSDPTLTVTVNASKTIRAEYYSRRESKTMQLRAGWNWISINDDDFTISKLLAAAVGKVTRIESATQQFSYSPITGWTGDLSTIEPSKSYRVFMNDDFTFIWKGITSIAEETPIEFDKGWNWVGFVPNTEMAVADALQNYEPQTDDVLKDYEGFAVYDGNAWVGTLGTMRPGVGYQYYSQNGGELTYSEDASQQNAPLRLRAIEEETGFSLPQNAYPDNMTAICTLSKEAATLLKDNGYKLLAFVGDECRGIGEYVGDERVFITVYGDDGDADDTSISFMVIDDANALRTVDYEPAKFTLTPVGTYGTPIEIPVTGNVILLDGREFYNQCVQQVETIKYRRTFKNTNWQAWYVPFEIDASEFERVAVFEGVGREENTLVFRTVIGTLTPNTPYIIRPKTAEYAELSATNSELARADIGSMEALGFRVSGTYTEKKDMATTGAFALDNSGTFRRASSDAVTLKPFRIYLEVPSMNAAQHVRVLIDGEVATSLDELIYLHTPDGRCYDLLGRPVQTPVKGEVYIIDGKKLIYK